MTRDYSRRAEPRQKSEQPRSPAWVPFFYGFFAGAILTGSAWMLLTPAGTPLQWPASLQKAVKSASSAKAQKDEPSRPHFDFYTILPEMEVIISDEDTAPPVPNYREEPVSTTSVSESSYRLQVGSFKRQSDADRQKAKLALLGVEAEIQRVNVASGETYYRVLTNKMSNRDELNSKQRLLQKNKINSLLVKSKN